MKIEFKEIELKEKLKTQKKMFWIINTETRNDIGFIKWDFPEYISEMDKEINLTKENHREIADFLDKLMKEEI